MGSLYDDGLALLKSRGIEFLDVFVPSMMCSYACHVLNLENHRRGFYKEYNNIPDLRLQVLLVAPPGFGKSFIMKNLMHETYGLLNTGFIPLRFEGYATEAGLIGSSERKGSQVIRIKGVFEEYSDGIIGVEEFFSISQAMNQTHSSHLEPALNQALLDGDVRKRLRSGPIEYKTQVTMWAGTQTTRFQVGGGLLRRFFLVNWVPTTKDENLMKIAQRKAMNLSIDPKYLKAYRSRVLNFTQDLKKIKSLTYSKDVVEVMDNVPHYRESVLRKFVLGYNLLNNPITTNFHVDMDSRLEGFIEESENCRRVLIGDPEGDMVLSIVREHNGKMLSKKLKEKLIDFSISFYTSNALISKLIGRRDLVLMGDYIYTMDQFQKERKKRAKNT